MSHRPSGRSCHLDSRIVFGSPLTHQHHSGILHSLISLCSLATDSNSAMCAAESRLTLWSPSLFLLLYCQALGLFFVFLFYSHTNSLHLSPISLFPLSFFSSTFNYKIFLSHLLSEILVAWFVSAAEQHKIKNINGRLSFIRDLTHWHTD